MDATRAPFYTTETMHSLRRVASIPGLASLVAQRAVVICLLLVAGGCSSVATELRTAGDLYRDARYEAAAAWLDALAPETDDMSVGERATFHYLRGMTAYRLAHYQEALHELALAANAANVQDNALTPTQHSVLERTLSDLTPEGASPHARTPQTAQGY